MKVVLFMVMCSATSNYCMPPVEVAILKSHYDCMIRGYNESIKHTQVLSSEEVNKHKIYFSFICKSTTATES